MLKIVEIDALHCRQSSIIKTEPNCTIKGWEEQKGGWEDQTKRKVNWERGGASSKEERRRKKVLWKTKILATWSIEKTWREKTKERNVKTKTKTF